MYLQPCEGLVTCPGVPCLSPNDSWDRLRPIWPWCKAGTENRFNWRICPVDSGSRWCSKPLESPQVCGNLCVCVCGQSGSIVSLEVWVAAVMNINQACINSSVCVLLFMNKRLFVCFFSVSPVQGLLLVAVLSQPVSWSSPAGVLVVFSHRSSCVCWSWWGQVVLNPPPGGAALQLYLVLTDIWLAY